MSANNQTFSMKDLKCEKVVVFQERAEVKRSIKTKLVKGENEIIINNVSNFIEHDSVRVEGSGDASVLDVVCQNKQIESKDLNNNEKAKNLLEEIKSLKINKENLNSKSKRFIKQQETLNAFAKNLAEPASSKENPSNSNENLERFYEFLDSYTNRLGYIDEELSKVNRDTEANDEKLKICQENYNRLNVIDYNEAT